LYEASEHNGPVLHYYVVVVKNAIAQHNDPNDFDIDQVVISPVAKFSLLFFCKKVKR